MKSRVICSLLHSKNTHLGKIQIMHAICALVFCSQWEWVNDGHGFTVNCDIPHVHYVSRIMHVLWDVLWPLQSRHNERDGISNYQPHVCLLNRLVRRRSKKTSKLCVTGLCVGNSPVTGDLPHNGPVTRKMFSFDDVIMDSPTRCTSPVLRSNQSGRKSEQGLYRVG